MASSRAADRKAVLVVGSSPSAPLCAAWNLDSVTKLALNNAWRLRPDFDYSFYPPDFPAEQRAPQAGNTVHIQADDFLPSLEDAGGRAFTGATMAFAAGYWACHALRPRLLAYTGCDMTYTPVDGKTHFYGTGAADPLRANISLRSLEAKSCRLFVKALLRGILVVNVSAQESSRLVFPRAPHSLLECWQEHSARLDKALSLPALESIRAAAARIEQLEQQSPFEVFHVGKIPHTPANLEFVDQVDRAWLQLRQHTLDVEACLLGR